MIETGGGVFENHRVVQLLQSNEKRIILNDRSWGDVFENHKSSAKFLN